MTGARLTRVAVAIATLSTVLTLAAVVLMVENRFVVGGIFWPALIFVGTTYAWVGARVVAKEPHNVVGWFLVLGACCWSINSVAEQFAWFATRSQTALPGASIGAWLNTWVWLIGTAMVLIFMPIYFPDGRLPSRRWKPVVGLMIGVTIAGALGMALLAWGLKDDVTGLLISNDLTDDPRVADTALATVVSVATLLIFAVGVPLAPIAVITRWRASAGVTRLQIRWFASATAVAAVFVVVSSAASAGGSDDPIAAGLTLAAMALPALAIGIAILRYRLYDIDRVVSRTLAYALVTGSLIVVYLGVNLGLTTLFSSATTSNSIVVAASTLVVAALFTPLRRRVGHLVDRRFDRARYDAERTTSAFSERLRDEMDIATVTGDLDSTVRAAMSPASLGLWLRVSGP